MKTKFEVVPHPLSKKKHILFKVTTASGYVYACTSEWTPEIRPKPDSRTVQYLWKHYRFEFLPYNEMDGTFVSRRVNPSATVLLDNF